MRKNTKVPLSEKLKENKIQSNHESSSGGHERLYQTELLLF